jgi:putative aldouronate transport system substrate-binding protein
MKKLIAIILNIILVLSITIPVAAISTIAVKSINLDKNKITLNIGETYNLKASLTPANTTQKLLKYVTWNQKVATIDKTGKITGVSAGTATIVVYTSNNKIFAKCNVTISQPLKPVTISWYLRHADQKDGAEVLAAMNKIIKEKINAELVIKRIDAGVYRDKLQILMASGEEFDLCHTAPRYDYYTYVAKGAFKPMDELLKNYAPKSYAQIPAGMWDAAKVGGKIYGLLNYQIFARVNGFVAQKYALDKYKFDLKSVKKLEDIEPLLAKIKAGEGPDVIPFECYKNITPYTDGMQAYLGFDTIIAGDQPGCVLIGDASLKVVNQFEQPSFKKYIELMRDWYLKGYIKKDAATVDNVKEIRSKGTTMVLYGMVAPGQEAQFQASMADKPIATVQIDRPFLQTGSIIATMTAVSKTSKNPERAVMLLELINTNADNIYNLMCFGIEGKHYNKISDTRIEPVKDSTYNPNAAWMFGNQFNAYLLPGQVDGVWDSNKKLNEAADKSKLLGFNFNAEPIKTEIAQCQSVIGEYTHGLCTGSVDPAKYLPEFLDKLKKANVDKIIAEQQRQINEWKKTR